VACPPDVNCVPSGCLSGNYASPPNGSPLYWPGVGGCPSNFSATYSASLYDSRSISSWVNFYFVCF
jgi:hypothetical protein